MCKKSGESIDHLLLDCKVARALWNNFFGTMGLAWVMPRRVLDPFTTMGKINSMSFVVHLERNEWSVF